VGGETEQKINLEIGQLKEDLDLLLNFNENLLHFPRSIVSQAARTKVETFFKTVTDTFNIENIVDTEGEQDKESKMAAASSILSVTEDISDRLASTVELGSSLNISLPEVSMTVLKRKMEDNSSSTWNSEGLSVSLPDQASIAGPDQAITVSFTEYQKLGSLLASDQDLTSSILSVHVVQARRTGRARAVSIPLDKPVQFTLTHSASSPGTSPPRCVYWDFPTSSWSDSGCKVVSSETQVVTSNGLTTSGDNRTTTTTCRCFHLTNFAVQVERARLKTTTTPPPPKWTTWVPLTYFSSEPSVALRPEYRRPVTDTSSLYTSRRWPDSQSEGVTGQPVVIMSARPRVLRRKSEKFLASESDMYEDFWVGETGGLRENEIDVLRDDKRRFYEEMETEITTSHYASVMNSVEILVLDSHKKSRKRQSENLVLQVPEEMKDLRVSRVDVVEEKDVLITAVVTALAVTLLMLGPCLCYCWSRYRRRFGKHRLADACNPKSRLRVSNFKRRQARLESCDLSGSISSVSSHEFGQSLEELNNFQDDLFLTSLEDDIPLQ